MIVGTIISVVLFLVLWLTVHVHYLKKYKPIEDAKRKAEEEKERMEREKEEEKKRAEEEAKRKKEPVGEGEDNLVGEDNSQAEMRFTTQNVDYTN